MADETPKRNIGLWKLGAYFLLLFVFAALNLELFRTLARENSFEGFTKVSELLDSSFDIVTRWDDIIITLYSLFMTFIFIVPIGWVYTLTKEEDEFDPSLAQTLVVLGLVVCGVMMLVQDNLARAFGLVGVVAAVRYRNTLKDPKDAVYVFLAIGIGMASGLRAFHIAVLLSLVIGLVFILLWKFRVGKQLRPIPFAIPESKKGKKGKALANVHAQMSAEARQQVEADLQLQARLWNLAGLMADKDKGIKRPNAALLITASTPAEAQQRIHKVLEAHDGGWQLANLSSINGATKFEYLGRVNKKGPLPAVLIEDLQKECKGHVTEIEFRSLKGMKKLKISPSARSRDGAGEIPSTNKEDES